MKKLMILPGIVLGACAAFAQAAPAAPQSAGQASAAAAAPRGSNTHGYEVSGTVVNAVNGEPLSKAKVSIYPVLSDLFDDQQDQGVFQFRQANQQRFNNARGGGGGARGAGGRGQNAQNQQEDNEPSTEALTDNTGHFVMKNVLPGRYSLFAERKGFPRQSLDRHGNFSTAVVVGAGKDSKNITFRAVPDSNITGRITDDFGDPVPNARVILFYKSSDTGEEGVRRKTQAGTDQDGNYHFNHLPPATYFVVVTAQPWYTMYARMMPQQSTDSPTPEGDANLDVAFAVTYYSGATDENDATQIPLLPGDHFVADMTLNTSPAMHLQFTNLDPKTPMMPMLSTQAFGQEIFVNAMPMMRRGPGGQPGPNGEQAPQTLTINVAPGRYDANVRTFNRFDGSLPGGPGVPTNVRRMTIDATGNAVVDLTKGEEPAPVTGDVKFEGATGDAPRGSITFRKQESTEVVNARTDNEGGIQNLQLYPGKYNVVANYSHYVIKAMSATGAKVTGRTIEVTGMSPIKFSLQMTTEDARVDGVVHAADSDTPVSGVMVMLVPEDLAHNEPLVRRFQSNTDGSFQFTKVIPGKYTVVALRNGWNMQWAKPEVIQSYLAQGESLEIGPKAKVVAKVKAQ